MTNSKGNKGDKQNKQKTIIIAVGIVALAVVAALITTIVVLLNREPIPEIITEVVYEPVVQLVEGPSVGNYERNPGGRGFVVTEDNVEEVRAAIEERRNIPQEDRRFEFSQTSDWRFATSLTPSRNALVRNVERNSRTVFFDVYIEDYGVVYVSPYMPLGSEHRNFALDVELPAGTYSATVTYFLVDDDLEILTDVSVGVTITIEN